MIEVSSPEEPHIAPIFFQSPESLRPHLDLTRLVRQSESISARKPHSRIYFLARILMSILSFLVLTFERRIGKASLMKTIPHNCPLAENRQCPLPFDIMNFDFSMTL